ncbi:uncharacterized protein LOC134242588 isoform X2 [Saccostrea cucullata]
MQEKSLKDLTLETSGKDAGAYPMGKIVVVVAKVGHTAQFKGSSGTMGSMLNFSIADKTDTMLATLSDESQMVKIQQGRTLQLRNFLVKGNRVVLSAHSKIMYAPPLNLPKEQTDKAVLLIQPTSPSKTIKEALETSLREIVSVQGQVIRDEAIKVVPVGQQQANIRTVCLKDQGHTMDVTLWRNLTEMDIKVGDFLELTHCIVTEWQKKKALNTTRNTVIKKVEPRTLVVKGEVEAFSFGDQEFELCLVEENICQDIKVNIGTFQGELAKKVEEASTWDISQLENCVVSMLPFPVEATMSGSDVQTFKIL